jgi:hypothetical protein
LQRLEELLTNLNLTGLKTHGLMKHAEAQPPMSLVLRGELSPHGLSLGEELNIMSVTYRKNSTLMGSVIF